MKYSRKITCTIYEIIFRIYDRSNNNPPSIFAFEFHTYLIRLIFYYYYFLVPYLVKTDHQKISIRHERRRCWSIPLFSGGYLLINNSDQP